MVYLEIEFLAHGQQYRLCSNVTFRQILSSTVCIHIFAPQSYLKEPISPSHDDVGSVLYCDLSWKVGLVLRNQLSNYDLNTESYHKL